MNVIDPRGLSAIDWVDYTSDLFSGVVPLMVLRTGLEWRLWGYHVRQTLSLQGILTPDPDAYSNWLDWAFRFNQVLGPVRF